MTDSFFKKITSILTISLRWRSISNFFETNRIQMFKEKLTVVFHNPREKDHPTFRFFDYNIYYFNCPSTPLRHV